MFGHFYRTMKKKACRCLVLSLAIASPAAAADNIRVSYASLSAAYMDHICAMDKGYLREEGLNVEVIRAPGGVATPGLLSGQFQFSSSASSAVSAAVRGGPVKIVYTNLSRPSYTPGVDKTGDHFRQRIGREKNRDQ